jgi:chemotaxis signal transduction protein
MRRQGVSSAGIFATDRVTELRRAFDRSFADAPPSDVASLEDLLEITVSASSYALRISEVSGLFADRKITPLPAAVPELLGITGFRGSILPVYDLAAMLGYPIATATTPRWLAIAAALPVGLAFEAFERHQRISRDAIVPQIRSESQMRHVREVFKSRETVRPIVSVASVLEAITSRARPGAAERER